MSTNSPHKSSKRPIWYMLHRIWAELYSRYQENFNPEWRKPLPPRKCEFCGKPEHVETYCPNAKGPGFLD